MKSRANRVLPLLEDRKRLVWLSVFLFFLFCLLVLQFFKIQIVECAKWTKTAAAQHQLVIVEPFKRGVFYSNTHLKPGHPDQPQPFVIEVPKFHLFIDPLAIPMERRAEMCIRLTQLLRLKGQDTDKIRVQFEKKSHSRKLIKWLAAQQKEQIEQWWGEFARKAKLPRNALYFVQDYKRSYPFGKLLGQVLHTVRDDREKLDNQGIPTGGLELIFNGCLKGQPGKRFLLRSPRHPLDTGGIITPPEHGADIYLTINHYLQAVAEEEIAKAVVTANAKTGWAIMMDPSTGEILALAQYPFFDPSHYSDYFNDPKKLEVTKLKSVTDTYEPGSTFKPITLAVCLRANDELKKRGKKPLLSPDEKVLSATSNFPGRSKPIKDTSFHRHLNMYMALQKSSNVYMAKMVQRVIEELGVDWYRSTLQNLFGFGLKTGVELPSESIGLLPTPGKKHPNGTLEWSVPTPFSLAMGHNILTTSMQMVRSFGIIANGGFDVKPTLIRKVVKTLPDGSRKILIDNTRPERVQSFARILEKESVDELVKAMKYPTKPGGSAAKADIPGYTEAGKTGTSEKVVNGVYSKNTHISTFIGFAPAKNPRFVLLIAIDEPEKRYVPGLGSMQMGGNCAAPAFREIGMRTLQYMGVPPDDPYGYPVGDPRRDASKADWMKEVEQLNQLYKQWNQ